MAEENDQNAVQPQNDEQQTAPTSPVDAEQTQAYTGEPYAAEPATEPIDLQSGTEEQPTAAMPVANDGASAESAAAAGDTPDYASAAGERTVVGGSTQDAPAQQYRPAPEYGAYGPVPTQPADDTAAANDTANGAPNMPPQPQYGAYGQASGQQPQQRRNPFFGNPYMGGNQQNDQQNAQSNNGNPFMKPAAQGGANVPPAAPNTPNNGNPFGNPNNGNPFGAPQQNGAATKPKSASGVTGHVMTGVVAALVSAALCLGVGYAAITNGWVTVPTSSSLTSVKSNTSGSGSAKAKSGEAADWSAVAKEVSDSVVSIDVATSDGSAKGSGAIISDKGYIVTNNHVISGAKQIQVTLANGTIYSAQIVGTDTTTDLAVIKLDNPPSDLKAAEFADSDNLAVGESVMAIGNPLGYDDTATVGIVSALNRPVTVSDDNNNDIVTNAVQIDAAVNPGNSGGPTFNAAGQVIGINSSIASTTTSSGTAGSIGIGFAIPSNLVKRVANEIIDNGTVQHVALGVTIKSSTVEADGVTRGCTQVQSVVDNSPAAKAGVKAGDSIVAFNGKAVNNNYSLLGYVRASAMNDKVTLTVVRDGNTMELDVTLDQEESQTNSSNSQNQRNNGNDGQSQNGNGNGYGNDGNGNGNGQSDGNGSNGYGDGGGLFDPFGLW
ncbi:PDZ domain-containing protein [Bifidobacterium pseudocatenulatum]|uniref:S1C family serine protease n=1 Tax=Bifidobacterium pseudocatenulatum TaxID=28026 RepID=UPI000E48C141|nr:trypsin-like peptidase domain-containing protein [Bifidobacterium pseudocatenulatum]QTL81637.1 trypsin-like peptidase domain-containing protein [Bifidobacterium pseudocatenulatum]RHJ45122.1 PDZ domain-containing protein [Bifidobacterium pseudocatenulatum]RHJ47559.1 PDZ domain-containing protein [Bifidobacterium pseudocatenulatum]